MGKWDHLVAKEYDEPQHNDFWQAQYHRFLKKTGLGQVDAT
jgi:hypothetical protein